MKISTLRRDEHENYRTEYDIRFGKQIYDKCEELFNLFKKQGVITTGDFSGYSWMCYSGLKSYGINFSFNELKYVTHAYRVLELTGTDIQKMIRCYAIYNLGEFVLDTIASKNRAVIRFLEEYGEKEYRIDSQEEVAISSFLYFIGFEPYQINKIKQIITKIKTDSESGKQRELAPIINYLAIENEINKLYKNGITDDEFIKWFPIYFWVNITFILPLRVTEMLVTPRQCIRRTDDNAELTIKRTVLKGKRKVVHYDPDKDYKQYTYRIPDSVVVRNIEKYIELIKERKYRFLFGNDYSINNMLSEVAFNRLLESFIIEHLIGNRDYDFARFAAGIDEFDIVKAGDSRPIAMTNLYFQGNGEDIVRQLAGHVNIITSAHYYTNISETIRASSIVNLQNIISYRERYNRDMYEKSEYAVIDADKSRCLSWKMSIDERDLSDCVEKDHLFECMGCDYFRPTKKELEEFLRKQEQLANESAKRVLDFIAGIMNNKNCDMDLDQLFLAAQTAGHRYKLACELYAKEKAEEWQKRKNSQRTFF